VDLILLLIFVIISLFCSSSIVGCTFLDKIPIFPFEVLKAVTVVFLVDYDEAQASFGVPKVILDPYFNLNSSFLLHYRPRILGSYEF
jgi:hypothetical protein